MSAVMHRSQANRCPLFAYSPLERKPQAISGTHGPSCLIASSRPSRATALDWIIA